jgi:hypothetical protein
MWSSPLLLLVLLFTVSSGSSTTTTTLGETPTSSVATTTTTIASTSSTTTTLTSTTTSATTSARRSFAATGSNAKSSAPEPSAPDLRGALTGAFRADFRVVDVPLVGPGTWTLWSSASLRAQLICPSVAGPVVGTIQIVRAEHCQLELSPTSAQESPTWQLTPVR